MTLSIKRKDIDYSTLRVVRSLWMMNGDISDESGSVRSEIVALGGDAEQAVRKLGGEWEPVMFTPVSFDNSRGPKIRGYLGTLNGRQVLVSTRHAKQSLWRVRGEIVMSHFHVAADPADDLKLERRGDGRLRAN